MLPGRQRLVGMVPCAEDSEQIIPLCTKLPLADHQPEQYITADLARA